MEKKRNYMLDLVKVIFAISIALGHFGKSKFLGSGVVVECFFIMSGFFLVQSFRSKKYKSAYEYTKKRILSIYPHYIFSFLVLFLFINIRDHASLWRMCGKLAVSLPEMLLIQNVGVFDGGINYPLWQLCALLVVSHLLFSLLEKDEKFTLNVTAPVLTLLSLTYLANVYGTHTPDVFTVEGTVFYIPLVRAMGNVCLGMIAHDPILEATSYLDQLKIGGVALSLAGVCCLTAFVLYQKGYFPQLFFVLFLIPAFSERGIITKVFDRACFKIGEPLSLAIYLNHALVIEVFKLVPNLWDGFSDMGQKGLFIAALLLYSCFTLALVRRLKPLLARLFEKRENALNA